MQPTTASMMPLEIEPMTRGFGNSRPHMIVLLVVIHFAGANSHFYPRLFIALDLSMILRGWTHESDDEYSHDHQPAEQSAQYQKLAWRAALSISRAADLRAQCRVKANREVSEGPPHIFHSCVLG